MIHHSSTMLMNHQTSVMLEKSCEIKNENENENG